MSKIVLSIRLEKQITINDRTMLPMVYVKIPISSTDLNQHEGATDKYTSSVPSIVIMRVSNVTRKRSSLLDKRDTNCLKIRDKLILTR